MQTIITVVGQEYNNSFELFPKITKEQIQSSIQAKTETVPQRGLRTIRFGHPVADLISDKEDESTFEKKNNTETTSLHQNMSAN